MNSPIALPTIEPQLATLVSAPPSGDAWFHEIKYDGFRAIAYLDHGDIHLLSRNGKSLDQRFASIRRALTQYPAVRAILDGEICAVDGSGQTRFELLQRALQTPRAAQLRYFVFDLLWVANDDLRTTVLSQRKERLDALFQKTTNELIRPAEYVRGEGEAFQHAARELGLEGMVSKRIDKPYRKGRSREWLKVKFESRQELVILGYTPPKGSRQRFGALLLGVADKEGAELRYAGKVGTGFDTETLEYLYELMSPLRIDRPPISDPPRERGAVWITPTLVAEIRFTEWTRDGRLRHPTFLGLRIDKSAHEVRRE